jgi:ParB-like chromosome segregation protein Spo0J
LQPIGITPEKVLVFGERRLCAARDILGWEKIPARIVDVQSVLHGQFAENLLRKQYTVSERIAIVEAMRSFEHGGDRRSKQVRKCDDENLTVDEAAKLAGLGGKDGYFRAKGVIDKAVPELVEAMDSERLSLSAAAKLAEATPEEQTECLTKPLDEKRWTAEGIQQALKRVRNPHQDGWDQTPEEICRKIIGMLEWTEDEAVLEPFRGDGNFYNNLPKSVRKDWCEVGKGRDFFEYRGPKPDTIITNPPFRDNSEGNNLVVPCLERCLQTAQKRVVYFVNHKVLNALTPSRLRKYENWGWSITHLSIWEVPKWSGRYYLRGRTFQGSWH